MVKNQLKAYEYKDIFVKLHRYQMHGAENLIMLLISYLHAKAEYMVSYIDLVAERTGVSATGHITTTNADVMKPIVSVMVEIDCGLAPKHKDIDEAWAMFMDDYLHNRIKL